MPRTPLTITNPAIYEDEEIIDKVMAQCLDAQTLYSCFPDDSQTIPEEGRWILVKEVPFTALPWEVPLYSIWRARPYLRGRQFKIGRRKISWPMTLAEITTPGGDLVLYPTEYVGTELDRWLDLTDQGVRVNFIGEGEPGDLSEQLFYMQSRGLRRKDALLLLLPNLTDSRFVYLTLEAP